MIDAIVKEIATLGDTDKEKWKKKKPGKREESKKGKRERKRTVKKWVLWKYSVEVYFLMYSVTNSWVERDREKEG